MQTSKFLESARLYFRPLQESDCNGDYVSWLNDEEVCYGNSHHVYPYTYEAALEYVRYANKTRDELILAIVLKESNKHIGNIALQKINYVYRSAEFAIIIGDKSAWGHKYGQEAARLLFSHGFSVLNLHRIGYGTFEDNYSVHKMAASLGMKEEGRRREAIFKRGQYLDLIEYGILKEEFELHFAK